VPSEGVRGGVGMLRADLPERICAGPSWSIRPCPNRLCSDTCAGASTCWSTPTRDTPSVS